MTARRQVRAAGCVVWRYGANEPQVLLVRRPRYGDWSFPKGKLDRGETAVAAAVREVCEETGLTVALGPRLPDQHYVVSEHQPKVVHYWAAEPVGNDDVDDYRPNAEIDELRWLRVTKARSKLTYPRDVDLLDVFSVAGFDSRPLIVLRHAEARSRKSWRQDDSERPLNAEGKEQARKLIPLLSAYGITHVVSSDSARCVDTVLPYVNSRGAGIKLDTRLSEEGCTSGALAERARRWLAGTKRIAVCTHRPVLPALFEALGVAPVGLEPAAMVVIHRRNGQVIDLEQHG